MVLGFYSEKIHPLFLPVVYDAQAYHEHPEPYDKVVQIEVKIDWTRERIIQEIHKTFPETPDLAVRIFECESRLKPTAVGPTNDYGIAQVHAPSWNHTALRLGLTEYKTDVQQNLQMARYIYEQAGKKWTPWVCLDMI